MPDIKASFTFADSWFVVPEDSFDWLAVGQLIEFPQDRATSLGLSTSSVLAVMALDEPNLKVRMGQRTTAGAFSQVLSTVTADLLVRISNLRPRRHGVIGKRFNPVLPICPAGTLTVTSETISGDELQAMYWGSPVLELSIDDLIINGLPQQFYDAVNSGAASALVSYRASAQIGSWINLSASRINSERQHPDQKYYITAMAATSRLQAKHCLTSYHNPGVINISSEAPLATGVNTDDFMWDKTMFSWSLINQAGYETPVQTSYLDAAGRAALAAAMKANAPDPDYQDFTINAWTDTTVFTDLVFKRTHTASRTLLKPSNPSYDTYVEKWKFKNHTNGYISPAFVSLSALTIGNWIRYGGTRLTAYQYLLQAKRLFDGDFDVRYYLMLREAMFAPTSHSISASQGTLTMDPSGSGVGMSVSFFGKSLGIAALASNGRTSVAGNVEVKHSPRPVDQWQPDDMVM